MHVSLEDWKNGWCGIELAISMSEIEWLISLLEELKADPDQHFHISSDYKSTGSVGDIEISVKSDDTPDNLFLLSTAILPGDEI